MTYIDFEKLKRERDVDPFAFSPADIEQTVAFTAEVMRDNTRKNPEAMAEVGAAICRVSVDAPTPRLRQRLAILGWLPRDPANDVVWQLDEPVDLAEGDNYLVSDFVAKHYAGGMNLLFAPDDGMFSGAAFVVAPGRDATPGELQARVKLLAERVWVAQAIVAPRVALAPFAAAVGRAAAKENAARSRMGLPALAAPSSSTLGRWLRGFRSRHWDRAGVGSDWRGYELDVGVSWPDGLGPVGVVALGRAPRRGGARKGGAAAPKPVAQSRAARAAVVLDLVREAAREGGRWEEVGSADGRTGRIWVVDLEDGMEAWFTTRFSGVQMTFEPSGYDDAVLMQRVPPPPPDDAVVDLYLEGVGKVLSVATRGGVDQVIGMKPGPWEARFGLPDQPWSAEVQRRLDRRRTG